MNDFLFCLNTSTIQPTPLLEKIRIASRAGYDAIEPWNVEIDDYLAKGGTMSDLVAALRDSGLRVLSMIALSGWTATDPRSRTVAFEDCRRRMEQAAALGSTFVVASPPNEPVDSRLAGESFGRLLDLGREVGVRPTMEFLGFVEGVKDLRSALEIARYTEDPTATIVADVYHLLRGGGTLEDIRTIRENELAIFHINDLPSSPPIPIQSDSDRVMIGEGIVDLNEVIGHLRAIGYRGALSLELFNPALWLGDPVEVARIGLMRMKELSRA